MKRIYIYRGSAHVRNEPHCPELRIGFGHKSINITERIADKMGRDNTSIVLAERPKDEIIPNQTFNVKTSPAPSSSDLQDGQILVEVLYLSLDPAMRGWLNGMASILSQVARRADRGPQMPDRISLLSRSER